MPEHNSHWQQLHMNSHKLTEHRSWAQAIGSKDAKTERADPQLRSSQASRRQTNRYLQERMGNVLTEGIKEALEEYGRAA